MKRHEKPKVARSRFSLQFIGIMTLFFFLVNIPALGTRILTATKLKVAATRRKICQRVANCNNERDSLHCYILDPRSMHSKHIQAAGWRYISHPVSQPCPILVHDYMSIQSLNSFRLLCYQLLLYSQQGHYHPQVVEIGFGVWKNLGYYNRI